MMFALLTAIPHRRPAWSVTTAALLLSLPMSGRTQDIPEALPDIEAADTVPAKASPAKTWRLRAELGAGRSYSDPGHGHSSVRRATVDTRWSDTIATGWQAALSNRVDWQDPHDPDRPQWLNSLRELRASWADPEATLLVDTGRVPVRLGQGYGFSPSDVFRAGALRSVVAINPVSSRENRLGTAMLRVQRLTGQGDSYGAIYAPKIAREGSSGSWSPDWGATNHEHRLVGHWGHAWSERANTQVVAMIRDRGRHQLGLSGSAVLADSWVGHADLAWFRDRKSATIANPVPTDLSATRQGSAGITWSGAAGWSVTAEAQYNGAAWSRADWQQALSSAPSAALNYLLTQERSQTLPSRRGALLYATRSGLANGKLDVTAMVRRNLDDRSLITWFEARYHLDTVDLAAQWQRNGGDADSLYGALPARDTLQLVVGHSF